MYGWTEKSRHREDGNGVIVSSGVSCGGGNTCTISATQTKTITTTWSPKLSFPEILKVKAELGFSYSDAAATALGYQMSWKDDSKERFLCFAPQFTIVIGDGKYCAKTCQDKDWTWTITMTLATGLL